MKTKSNLVHTYVEGASFKNIFGGESPTQFGYIIHVKHMSPEMTFKWPWMKNKWQLSTATSTVDYFNTLREAKAAALEKWPKCYFKTRKQYQAEHD